MFSQWMSKRFRNICFFIILMSGFLLFRVVEISEININKVFCNCSDGYLSEDNFKVDRFVEMKRHISSILVKAANDVRLNRRAMAEADLRSAAASLDYKYDPKSENEPSKPTVLSPKSTFLPSNFDPLLTLGSLQTVMDNLTLDHDDIYNLSSSKKYNSEKVVSEKVTILIDECRNDDPENIQSRLKNLISQMRELWPNISIIIGSSHSLNKFSDYQRISTVQVKCDKGQRAPVSVLLENVATPFVLYLKSCAAVTPDMNLFRLLQVAADNRGVGIVGMSERGADGGWDYTCLQIKHDNSHLTLIEGYDYSKGSCIFCDVSSKSFLAVTQIIKSVLPDSSLPESARQIDWALRLKMSGVLTVTCPEIMTHTLENVMPFVSIPNENKKYSRGVDKIKAMETLIVIKKLYRKLAQKWQLTTIDLYNKTSLEYNCSEIHFNCKVMPHVQQYMLPPCCIKIKNKMIRAFDFIAKETLIPYEITAGTLLGAVKFRNAIPWDFDEDTLFPNKFVNILKQNKERFHELGVPTLVYGGTYYKDDGKVQEYLNMNDHAGFLFEIWGVNALKAEASMEQLKNLSGSLVCLQYGHYPVRIDKFLNGTDDITQKILLEQEEINKKRKLVHKQFLSIPKKSCYLLSFVRIGDTWVVAPWNPALDSIKVYGENIFKHVEHWRFMQNNNSWPICSYPGHPLCLDIHPRDGSIPFM